MISFLPPWPLFSAFLLASLVLAVTPGPGVLYIVTRSLAQGRRVGLTSVAGVALGNFGNAVAASIGLAAIFAVSSIAFTLVKYLGATYLVYLGISTWMAPSNDAAAPQTIQSFQEHAFRDGFVVALLNPKTAIFFAAFLPQFVGAPEASMTQTLVLGAIFVVIAAVTDSFYALAAGTVAPVLRATRGVTRLGRGITGAIFVGLGLLTAFGSNRTEVNAGVNN
jgi:threonine/homoserine/homoserine lactone efflux protein